MNRYRPDVDGLRAVAVVAVVLFHARIGPFTGGFVGVDVFFVISGYLIAGIILDDIAAGHFSLAAFYDRRLRRLFPALCTVLIACSIGGYLLFLPEEFRKFGQSVVATSVFVSNFLFWSQSGYFDSPPDLKPLLHTWSLAVEEQFYLVFPALLMLATRHAKGALGRVVIAVGLVSFALSAATLARHPDTAFYLPHTRLWELMVGAFLVTARLQTPTTPLVRALLGGLGLALIGISCVAYSAQTPFPGPAALLPCIGAALIIYAGRGGESVVHSLLATRPIVHIGLISYSLYLWHWPILVFARAWLVRPLTMVEAAALIGVSFGIAEFSWRFVETPFRERRRFSRRTIFALAGAATFVTLGIGTVIDVGDGLPSRVPSNVVALASGSLDVDSSFRRRCSNFAPEQISEGVLCKLGSRATQVPTFILWGDSHAYALASVVSDVAGGANATGLFAGSGGCAPLLGVSRTVTRAFPCAAFNDRVIDLIRGDAALRTVLLASRWTLTADGRRYRSEGGNDTFVRDAQTRDFGIAENQAVFRRGLERTLTALSEADKRVVVVGPIPEVGVDVPTTLARNLWFDRTSRIAPTRAEFSERQRFVIDTLIELQRRFSFELIEPDRVLCDARACRVANADHVFYSDDNHLSITGARLLRPLFEPILRQENAS